jgi:hypothetical protein
MGRYYSSGLLVLTALLALGACEPSISAEPVADDVPQFVVAGKLEAQKLDEASGLQAGRNGVFFLHNDGKDHIYVIDSTGKDLGRMKIQEAKSVDWEDITRVHVDGNPVLVIGDTGDNKAGRSYVSLYFIDEPAEEQFNQKVAASHQLKLRYPDGPRDVESIAYDPYSDMILLLSKRDKPPRLYGVPLDSALAEQEMKAEFLGEIHPLPPPTRSDLLKHPKRGLWISQPTGMDISQDGRLAAVITYRSLYVYERNENQTWLEAFQREPAEFRGPPRLHEEGVAFSEDQQSIYVATEQRPAPLHRLDIDDAVLRAIRHEIPTEP